MLTKDVAGGRCLRDATATEQASLTLPDGLHDVPADRIAAVVTSLEMKSRPALRPEMSGPWQLRRMTRPEPDAYRALYGEDRRRMDLVLAPDDERRRADGDPLASAGRGVRARRVGRARRPARAGLPDRGRGRAGVLRRHRAPGRRRRGALADEPRPGEGLAAADLALLGAHLHAGSSQRPRLLHALGLRAVPAADRDRARPSPARRVTGIARTHAGAGLLPAEAQS